MATVTMHRLFLPTITLFALGLLLTACGNPGALYLPDEQPATGNQGSLEYVPPGGPAASPAEGDEAWQGGTDGPAMEEADAQEAAAIENTEEDEAEKDESEGDGQDRVNRPGP